MRLTRQKQELAPPELNMAPMIDVVFLLLIFFVCTSTVNQLEGRLPSHLSQLGPGTGPAAADFPPHVIRVQRVPDGVVMQLGETRCTTRERLVEELRKIRTSDEVPVLIKGQGTVPFGDMVAALDACYQAGFQRVAFSTQGGEP
jgi:biopolymer transport protein ExbD